jgi:UDP-2,3-diacylglucosamine hydrolase
MEHRHYVPKAHFGVLCALRELRRAGVPVHYLSGNHDFNLGEFFRRELGVETHDGPYSLELQGKRVLLLHGDGMDPADRGYHAVKKVLRSPLANRLYRLLHPDLGMALALRVGQASRSRHGNVPRHLDRYEAAARELLRAGHDIVMHGHVHAGFVKRFPEGIYVNTGEWLERLQYVEMTDGECTLRTYQPSDGRPLKN